MNRTTKTITAAFAALWLATTAFAPTTAFAQRDRDRYSESPFTQEEERVMDEVWPQIRQAADFDDIDWRSVGLRRAPGDAEARAIMTRHWGALREAADFDDIDWSTSTNRRDD